MRFFRWLLGAILVVVLIAASFQTLQYFGVWGNLTESQVRSLDEGDQEIALIEPATSTDDWARLYTAIKLLETDWLLLNPALPRLHVADDAFPALTSDVPEITLWLGPAPNGRLRLRWYKITGEHSSDSWVGKLQKRGRPPLAIIGGATSDRAVKLGRALQAAYPDPAQPSPVFLITTATADRTGKDEPLVELYAKRTFRYSFTNHAMVEALLRFVKQNPNVWTRQPAEPDKAGHTMHTVVWQDERYSQDLAELFRAEFRKFYPEGRHFEVGRIRYSVGDFFHPSPLEQAAVDTFLADHAPIAPHSLLVLPTQTTCMRRFLMNLRQRDPQDTRNLVILNGDALSFNSVYRDRDVVWNILDLPFSVVFFCHRNPIERAAGFTWIKEDAVEGKPSYTQKSTTGTNDVLLYTDLVASLLYAAHDDGRLTTDFTALPEKLRATTWQEPLPGTKDAAVVRQPRPHADQVGKRPFFDEHGNRSPFTGEHIVWVKPNFADDRVEQTSTISVWTVRPNEMAGAWQLVEAPHNVAYNQNR